MIEDNSLEFDMFEDVRLNLTGVLMRSGRERIEAERIALYIVQGVREVPKLLSALAYGDDTGADAQVLEMLHGLLDNAPALLKARDIMLGLDDQPLH
ncbi:MAG TPA: hypothetical protein VF666_21275 [Pyrinomonadaceae bacterium]|jgi:hypothetical protein